MTAQPATRPCRLCFLPELEGYPHNHERPMRSSWDPMPERPERLYCGRLDVNAYWTEPGWRPDCCLIHLIAAEWRAELPERLHPVSEGIPTRLEPIPVEPRNLAGPMIEVPDHGALGGWPWAAAAARRFGGVTMWQGEQTLDAADYRIFPWAYVLERRLEGHCRRRHAGQLERWPEHGGQPICRPLLRAIIARGVPPELVAARTHMPPDRLAAVLEDSLLWVWRRVSEALNEIETRAKKAAG